MASQIRPETNPIEDSQAHNENESVRNRDFYMVMRRLECVNSDKPRIGTSKRAAEDPARLCQKPSLAFAPTTVDDATPRTATHPPRIFVNFLGLLGPNGPMPMHITELARDRERNFGDPTMARFFDIFNHRMISLFYRAWANSRPAVSFDRFNTEGDRFADYIGSLFGTGMDSLQNRDSIPDLAKLHYSGRLVSHTRNPLGLRAIIADYFKIETEIEEFVGQWIKLPANDVCKLGQSRATGLMGQNTIIGSSIWDCQQKFRIKMGPVTFKTFQYLLPGGKALRQLIDWVKNYCGYEYLWDLQLILLAAEVPALKLGIVGQLGWSTWLTSKPVEKDSDDLILDPLAVC